jgi:hypothetical protein
MLRDLAFTIISATQSYPHHAIIRVSSRPPIFFHQHISGAVLDDSNFHLVFVALACSLNYADISENAT